MNSIICLFCLEFLKNSTCVGLFMIVVFLDSLEHDLLVILLPKAVSLHFLFRKIIRLWITLFDLMVVTGLCF